MNGGRHLSKRDVLARTELLALALFCLEEYVRARL